MSYEGLLSQTITIVRTPMTGAEDRYGRATAGTAERTDWACFAEEISGRTTLSASADTPAESVADRDTRVREFRILLAADADVLATDQAEFEGELYEVTGTPLRPVGRGGEGAYVEARIRGVSG